MSVKKTERNQQIYELRMSDPVKWSYYKLARKFRITEPRVWKIFHSMQEKGGEKGWTRQKKS